MRIMQAGFTLIELSVATAILGILASIALGPFAGMIEHHRATAAVESLQSHMALARTTAITYNRSVVLCPSRDGRTCSNDTDWSGGWLLFIDQNRNRQPDPGDEILRKDLRTNDGSLRIASSGGRRQLRYRADGSSAGTNLTLSICGRSGKLLDQIIVNNVGRPRSQRPRTPTACPV